MATDFIKVLQEIRGTGEPEVEYTDGIYHDITLKETDDDDVTPRLAPGMYKSMQVMYDGVGEVLDISDEIVAVAAIDDEVVQVATIDDDVVVVAGIHSDVTTVATNDVNVTKVAVIDADVTKVANIDADVVIVSTNDANVTKVANNDANVTKVADIDGNVTIVADNDANVTIVADGIEDINNYADTYYGGLAAAPTIGSHPSLSVGDMYYDTVLDELRVYDNGDVWKSAGSTVNGTSKREDFVATAGQTNFTIDGGYDAGFADVYRNGWKLQEGEDIDISSGTEIVLISGADVGDIIDVVCYGAFVLADHYTKAENDAQLNLKATKAQDVSTDTVYTDATTATEYKIYLDNGDIILEEI